MKIPYLSLALPAKPPGPLVLNELMQMVFNPACALSKQKMANELKPFMGKTLGLWRAGRRVVNNQSAYATFVV